ncbi:unnamed protein product [Discosporangium mesarthrocarpum]
MSRRLSAHRSLRRMPVGDQGYLCVFLFGVAILTVSLSIKASYDAISAVERGKVFLGGSEAQDRWNHAGRDGVEKGTRWRGYGISPGENDDPSHSDTIPHDSRVAVHSRQEGGLATQQSRGIRVAEMRGNSGRANGSWQGVANGIPSQPRGKDDIHLVFSTDCTPYQNYQSLILFHSAETVEQMGPITRVASGCSEDEKSSLTSIMAKQPERFRIHFTPDYSIDPLTNAKYPFYNKPNGMAHFLRHADPPVQEAVLGLLDPDMVLVGKVTPYVGNDDLMLWQLTESKPEVDWVVEGKPVGQFYGLSGNWVHWEDLPGITAQLGEDSPARKVSIEDAENHLPVGPPYMMHPRDWTRLIDHWVGLAPYVNKGHPGILAEMYAFCIAAAHLGLMHRVAYGLMVSDAKMRQEGWPLIDKHKTEVCNEGFVEEHTASIPPIIHYCQMFRVGTFVFAKRHADHHSFFSCTSDALELPPPGYLAGPWGLLRIHPERRKGGAREEVPRAVSVRQGYVICAVLRAMNSALSAYKKRYCEGEEVSGGVRRFTDLSPAQLVKDYTAVAG